MGKQRIKSKNVRSRLTYDEDEWGSLLPFFREKYALDEGGYAENTADKWYKSVRKFFIWFKVNRLKGVKEEDFIDYRYTSTEDPKYEAEEVVEWTEEKLNRKFKEDDGYGLIDADRCIEKEKEGENRSNFLKRFREKKRAAEDPALGTVHVDVEDVKNVRAVWQTSLITVEKKSRTREGRKVCLKTS